MPRLRILQNREIKEFDYPPVLDDNKRALFFNLDLKIRKRSEFLRNETLLGFILLKGYFLAYQKIIKPSELPRGKPRGIVHLKYF